MEGTEGFTLSLLGLLQASWSCASYLPSLSLHFLLLDIRLLWRSEMRQNELFPPPPPTQPQSERAGRAILNQYSSGAVQGQSHVHKRDILSWYGMEDRWWWGVSPEKYNARLSMAACILGNWWEVHCNSFQWEAGQEWGPAILPTPGPGFPLFGLWVWQNMGRRNPPFVSWSSLRARVWKPPFLGAGIGGSLGGDRGMGGVEWVGYERKR